MSVTAETLGQHTLLGRVPPPSLPRPAPRTVQLPVWIWPVLGGGAGFHFMYNVQALLKWLPRRGAYRDSQRLDHWLFVSVQASTQEHPNHVGVQTIMGSRYHPGAHGSGDSDGAQGQAPGSDKPLKAGMETDFPKSDNRPLWVPNKFP